ncbi:uncharacterized protein si:ch211-106h4.12 [Pseudorasbora parva]|uniref:uncharacterized protein si:ch211-106h4.12 n=1 Tax=Pseudorasbora parva TaxID=51549 RepID=UPI00351DCD2B
MKSTRTAESSRMKGSVPLGLLWLSLLISSLHGEVQTESSKESPLTFEEPSSSSFSLHQPEMHRARRQTVEKEDTETTELFAPQSETFKTMRGKRPHSGAFSVLKVKPSELKVYHRTKRQEKKRKKPIKKHPGFNSFLAIPAPQLPQPARTKRDERAGGKRPWPGS